MITKAPTIVAAERAAEPLDRRRLALLALAHAVTDSYGNSFLSPIFPLLAARLGLSMTMVGGLPMVMGLSSSLGQPLLGYVSDRRSRICFVALGPAVAAVGCGLVGHMPGYAWLLACLFVTGLGIGAFHPQGALLAKRASGGGSFAMSAFTVGGSIGFGLAPLASALALRTLGLSRLPWIALPGLLLAAIVWRVVSRDPGVQVFRRSSGIHRDEQDSQDGKGRGLNRPGPGTPPLVPRTIHPPVHPDHPVHPVNAEAGPEHLNTEHLNPHPAHRALGFLTATVAVRATVQIGMTVFLPFHLMTHGLPGIGREAAKGLAVSAFLLVNAFAGPLGGHLSDRFGRKRVMFWSFLLATPPLIMAFQLPGYWGLAMLSLGGGVLALPHPANVVMAQELLPERAGIAASLITGLAWGVALLLALPLGAVADHLGVDAVLHGLALLPLLGVPLVMPIRDPKSRRQVG